MTAVSPTQPSGAPVPVPEGYVKLTIDDSEVIAPKGEMIIRTCERIGIEIPRFCDHPLLDPVAACRQCLVEVEMGGRKMPKPQPSCATAAADGMVVNTQLTSKIAEQAQWSNLEFLLLNHPLDCPVCDKGGECPLQNQDQANGPGETRFKGAKRVFEKPLPISTEILLDRDRCVLCYRCTRFSEQIAGDHFIDMLDRGYRQQVGIGGPTVPFQSYFSGNTIQICPVGALTSTAYRFRSRPFDLVSTPTVCENCAAGCAIRTDHRNNAVLRRLAGDDPEVNEEWNCDKGRFAFNYPDQPDRITRPLVRNPNGELVEASWTAAMTAAANGLLAARASGGVGVLTGGRLTVTDAYAYAKFARVALHTNDIDFRVRDHSAEEAEFLAHRVVGSSPETGGVTYAALESAPAVLLVALEPEEECPILFLRLRKAADHRGVQVFSVGAVMTRGLAKMSGTLVQAAPGDEARVVGGLAELVAKPGSVVLVGERAAQQPGLLTAVGDLADATGAGLAWVPRRAGERGALLAGALGTLLPGGRPVTDAAARAQVASAWGVTAPERPGRDTAGILEALATGDLAGAVVAGVDLADMPDPAAARAALVASGFIVSLEIRRSAATELADVVLPVAAPVERSGDYLNWEGRARPFEAALTNTGRMDDGRVLDTLGVEMDVDLYTQTPAAAAGDMRRLGGWSAGAAHGAGDGAGTAGDRELGAEIRESRGDPRPTGDQEESPGSTPGPVGGAHRDGLTSDAHHFRLASWRMLLDGSRCEDGEPHLAGTARAEVVRLSAAAANALGAADGDELVITGRWSISLPLAVSDMVDGAVWVPARVDGRPVRTSLGVRAGDVVTVAPMDGSAR